MRKHGVSILLAIMMVVALFPAHAHAATVTTPEGIVFNESTGQITGYTGSASDLVIPDTINGITVVSIGDRAFRDRSHLKSIDLPDGITSIGNEAFIICKNLESVNLPANLVSIGERAFDQCGLKGSIILPDSLTTIGADAFLICKNITSVTIPPSVTSIGVGAFRLCSGLTAINVDEASASYQSIDGVLFNESGGTLLQYPGGKPESIYAVPEGTSVLGNYSFNDCDNIEAVILPGSLTEIKQNVFASCSKLADIEFPNGLLSIGYNSFSQCNSLTHVVLPESVLSLGQYAFEGCQYLESIQLSGDLQSIGAQAFERCGQLRGITIPSSVNSIGNEAFNACRMIREFIVEEGNTRYKSVDGVLLNTSGTTLIQHPAGSDRTAYAIPNGVTHLARSAFSGCQRLQSISIPNTVTHIDGDSAFASCISLKTITIPNSVISMPTYVFSGCIALQEISVEEGNPYFRSIDGVLFDTTGKKLYQYPLGSSRVNYKVPAGTEEIAIYAFYPIRLDNIYIPNSITTIHAWAFTSPYSEPQITIFGESGSAAESYANSNNLDFVAGDLALVSEVELDKEKLLLQPRQTATLTATIYPQNAQVKNVTWATDNINIVSVENGVITAGNITGSATITVTSLDQGRTDTCEVQVQPEKCSVTFSTNGYGAVGAINRPVVVDYGSAVAEPPPMPFFDGMCFADWYPTSDCNTAPVSFPFTPTEERTVLYAKWESPDFTATYGDYDFQVMNGKATITDYHGSGGSVTIPSMLKGYPVTQIGSHAFQYNADVTYITIPSGVTSIGEQTFYFCSILEGISIPNSVERIGWNAFGYCTSLKTLTLPENLNVIDCSAFYNCNSMTSIIIPEGVSSIEASAFECSALESVTIPESVTYLGDSAFAQCLFLSSVYFKGNAPYVETLEARLGVFDGCDSDFTIWYSSSAAGFSNPWYGYPAKTFNPNTALKSVIYSIKRPAGYVKGVLCNTSADDLKQGFLNRMQLLKVSDSSGAEYNSGSIATGMTIELIVSEQVKDKLSICVSGDVNGDGRLSIADYTLVRLHILKLKSLSGLYKEAGDVDGNSIINTADYTLIRSDILGLIKIH